MKVKVEYEGGQIEVLNGTATLMFSATKGTSQLVVKEGFLPLASMNPPITSAGLDNHGIKLAKADRNS